MSNDKVTIAERGDLVTLQNQSVRVQVDTRAGTWEIMDRTNEERVIRDACICVDEILGPNRKTPNFAVSWRQSTAQSRLGAGLTLHMRFVPLEGYKLTRMLRLTLYEDSPFLELGWGVRNPHPFAVRVCEIDLLHGGEFFEGEELDNAKVLRGGAGAEMNRVEEGAEINALNSAMLTGHIAKRRRTLVAGGLQYSEFARRVVVGKGKITLKCFDPQGKRIEPGEAYNAEDSFYLDVVTTDPFDSLEAYAEALRQANSADPNNYDFPTLCGWMVSTKHLGEGKAINDSVGLVEQTRIARDRGLMKYTPLAVRLEPDFYCYKDHGDTQQGWWDDEHWAKYSSLREPYDTFDKFCHAVAELGGIPFTYFQASMPSNDFAIAHPEWMLNKDISRVHADHPHHRPFVRYDYSHPGFQDYVLNVWKRLRAAGLKGVKFDYPETAWARNGGFHDETFTTVSAYRELFRLCREGLGDDAFLHERILGGRTHEDAPCTDVTAGIVDLQRVWGDCSHFEPAMASIMGLRWYKSRRVFRYYPDGKSFYRKGSNDPIPAPERQAFLTLVAFLCGRLEIGTSIGSMTDEMLHDMTRIFPAFGGRRSPRPVDMLMDKPHPEVYVYEVSPAWSQVLLVNNTDRHRRISAPLSGDPAETGACGLDSNGTYHAFDFWAQRYLGKLDASEAVSAAIPPAGVVMISLRKVSDYPQLISTNRHIMQGMVECHGVEWQSSDNRLVGQVDVIGGEPFALTIACNGWRPETCQIPRGNGVLRQRTDGADLVDVVISSDVNRRLSFTLQFAQ